MLRCAKETAQDNECFLSQPGVSTSASLFTSYFFMALPENEYKNTTDLFELWYPVFSMIREIHTFFLIILNLNCFFRRRKFRCTSLNDHMDIKAYCFIDSIVH